MASFSVNDLYTELRETSELLAACAGAAAKSCLHVAVLEFRICVAEARSAGRRLRCVDQVVLKEIFVPAGVRKRSAPSAISIPVFVLIAFNSKELRG